MNILINFLNPEIMKLYNHDVNTLEGYKRQHILELTKVCYILTSSSIRGRTYGFDRKIIMPVTYFGEIEWIDEYLCEIECLIDKNIICYTSSTPDVEERIELKKKEYRDNCIMLRRYDRFDFSLINKINYQPKSIYSAGKVITEKWKESIEAEEKFWVNIISRNDIHKIDAIEKILYRIPESIDGKALIYDFMRPAIPLQMDKREEAVLGLRLSEYYLMSFFYEFDCRIITNTKFGMLDCSGKYLGRCTISYEYIYQSLSNLKLQFLLDLSLKELTQKMDKYFVEFQIIMDFIVNEYDNPSMETSLKWKTISNIINKRNFFGGDSIQCAANAIRKVLLSSDFSRRQTMNKKNVMFQLFGIKNSFEDHSVNTIADSDNSKRIIISTEQKEQAIAKLSTLSSLIEMDTNVSNEDVKIAKAYIDTLKKELDKSDSSKTQIDSVLKAMQNINTIVGFGKIVSELIAVFT